MTSLRVIFKSLSVDDVTYIYAYDQVTVEFDATDVSTRPDMFTRNIILTTLNRTKVFP